MRNLNNAERTAIAQSYETEMNMRISPMLLGFSQRVHRRVEQCAEALKRRSGENLLLLDPQYFEHEVCKIFPLLHDFLTKAEERFHEYLYKKNGSVDEDDFHIVYMKNSDDVLFNIISEYELDAEPLDLWSEIEALVRNHKSFIWDPYLLHPLARFIAKAKKIRSHEL